MTAKFDNFLVALEALCRAHQVSIDVGYDGVEIFDRVLSSGYVLSDTVFEMGIRDSTEEDLT